MTPPGRRRSGSAEHDQLAVVVQADDRLPSTLVVVAPLATSPLAVTAGPEVTVCGEPHKVLVELVVSMEAGRLGTPVDHLDAADLASLDDALRDHLGLA
jgi:mRNA interferase MazF